MAAVERGAGNSSRRKFARVVVPDSPQFESEPVDRPQSPPVAEEILLRRFGAAKTARMKLDQQLLDILEALRTRQNRVERAPFGTLDVDLQNVDCRLCNTTLRQTTKTTFYVNVLVSLYLKVYYTLSP